VTQIDWTRATKYFLLMDFLKGFGLGMKYFFAPKSTVNYPHEKGPLSPRYRYDQLMRIGWKVFLPMSLAWVVIVAFLAKFEVMGGFWARWAVGA
jgi:hypothetical protein